MMGRTVGLLLLSVVGAARESASAQAAANPIRKVVTMLSNMKDKVEEEGKKSEGLYDKFMCWCSTGGSGLQEDIDAANTKIPQLASQIEQAESKKAQLEEDLKQHQADREAAKKSIEEATAIRTKEKAAFDAATAELQTNLAAIGKAVAALEKGMGGSFLQSGEASTLRGLLSARSGMAEGDRQELLAFLSGSASGEYSPSGGEITGILKQIGDEMSAEQQDTLDAEAKAVKEYDALMVAKNKEIATLTQMIEEKLSRVADLGVEIAAAKNDHEDTLEGLAQDQAYLTDLKANCATATSDWEAQKKTRAEELVALSETIKLLNDDDALELFKRTLPSASSSFMELRVTESAMRSRALALVGEMRSHSQSSRPQLDFIAMALHGKKMGFDKVIALVDDLVSTLKKEMQDDLDKKEYCGTQLDITDDKKKALTHALSDLDTVIANTEESIATASEDIANLVATIKALDTMVAEATAQRKSEHAEYKELMANDSAAKELLRFAQNRLNRFYNPKLHKAAPKRELSEEDRIVVNQGGTLAPTEAPGGIGGTGIEASLFQLSLRKDAPPPPPQTMAVYTKKSEETGGVMAMVNLLVQDLDKEMTEAETTEKDAQGDYDQLMKDSAAKRTQDAKALSDKEATKADLQGSLEDSKGEHAATTKELSATNKYDASLHAECDWLLKYFDVRKEARDSEIDALGKARAVLSGADYSFVQTRSTRSFLRGQM